jgi:hypothetical protein
MRTQIRERERKKEGKEKIFMFWYPWLNAAIQKIFQLQSNLGSRTPRVMNNSVYEQIFRTQSVSDDCRVSSYEHASRQHRGAISWEYQRRQYS